MNGWDRRPGVSLEQAAGILWETYGIRAEFRPLAGERDATMAVQAEDGSRYVLKISPADAPPDEFQLEAAALRYLEGRASRLRLPRIVPTSNGAAIREWKGPAGRTHQVRLYTWLQGEVWARVRPHTPRMRESLGEATARLCQALEGFDHPAAGRDFPWDLTRLDRVAPLTSAIEDGPRRSMAEAVLAAGSALQGRLSSLPQAVLYNDANDWNVLVDGMTTGEAAVVGFVDFGDMVKGPRVIDLAIAIAYAAMETPDPLGAASDVVAGFHQVQALSGAELSVLLPLIQARLAVSVTLSAHRTREAPPREYLTISEEPAWALLERLTRLPENLAEYWFRAACGFEPCPASRRVRRWLETNQGEFRPVLGDRDAAPAAVIDLGIGTTDYGTLADLDDLDATSRAIEARIAASGARVGIGRWNEVRAIYRADAFRVEGNERKEYRTVHLGVDLFVPPGTPVHAPLEGTVHSARDNVGRFDYGPTVVLEHSVRDAEGEFTFHTLYGHLALDSLAGLTPGTVVPAGTRIGSVGSSSINGGWPPHVHVQVICDLMGHGPGFAGVSGIRERAVSLSVSPDPGHLIGVPAEPQPPGTDHAGQILAERRARLGPSLSVSYSHPLHIVRGFGSVLYDADGQPFLDCVNNVAHVGHCHPRVVAAASAQKAVLETNTRYLHEHMVRLAERLATKLPSPLEVCYFVNSGSEANELALRMARTATGRRGVIVLDAGYHGNTTTLIDVSPYKHAGPGGQGAPPWVAAIPLPDPYRGAYRDDPDGGRRHAAHTQDAAARLRENGFEAGAFLAESIVSCGGQIVPPAGFLAEAYSRARAEGAVCIADEVQTGLGRVGDAFWAFELQGVVPDIVTIGKPFGNGHPLAAVVTTRGIADAFANGMEYFNTFGGNTVSCAVGLAVLEVIESEDLQANARVTGAALLGELRALQQRHPIMGDVRGHGLFLGFELVRGRDLREPAAAAAARLVDRARMKGVLLSTDGPDHNVIKIKPPLCFTRDQAQQLAAVVDEVLSEDFFR